MKAKVIIHYKDGILEPQGVAITKSLHELGYRDCTGARVGKIILLELDEFNANRARQRIEEMCKILLANPVIEDYQIEVM